MEVVLVPRERGAEQDPEDLARDESSPERVQEPLVEPPASALGGPVFEHIHGEASTERPRHTLGELSSSSQPRKHERGDVDPVPEAVLAQEVGITPDAPTVVCPEVTDLMRRAPIDLKSDLPHEQLKPLEPLLKGWMNSGRFMVFDVCASVCDEIELWALDPPTRWDLSRESVERVICEVR